MYLNGDTISGIQNYSYYLQRAVLLILLFIRPDYKKLCVLKEKFPCVPTMALTATATPRVRLDILKQLAMKNPKWSFIK